MPTPVSTLILACCVCCGSLTQLTSSPSFCVCASLQVASTPSWLSLVCGSLVSTLSSITVPTRSQATWRTLLDSLNGWKKPCEKPLRAWRRSESCLDSALWSASHCCMLGVSRKEVNVACFLLQVYIIAHVPVGYLPFVSNTTAVREPHNERLVAICRQYSSVIAGHFYGHTHRDSIMVLLDQQGEHNVIITILIVVFCRQPPPGRVALVSPPWSSRFWDCFWLFFNKHDQKARVELLKNLSNWILCVVFFLVLQGNQWILCLWRRLWHQSNLFWIFTRTIQLSACTCTTATTTLCW